jgi:hypothetical protein
MLDLQHQINPQSDIITEVLPGAQTTGRQFLFFHVMVSNIGENKVLSHRPPTRNPRPHIYIYINYVYTIKLHNNLGG